MMTNQPNLEPTASPKEGRVGERRVALPGAVVRPMARFLETGLRLEQQQGRELLHSGPEYYGTTSAQNGSREIKIQTIYADQNPGEGNRWKRHYYVVALDAQTGNIVGNRVLESNYFDANGQRQLQVDGRIDTVLRGGGVASIIERATIDLLQRQADVLGIDISWHITNSNLETLGELRHQLAQLQEQRKGLAGEAALALDGKIADLSGQVTDQESQQAAWQHLYRDVVGATGRSVTGSTPFPTEIWGRPFIAKPSSAKESVTNGVTDVSQIALDTSGQDAKSPVLMSVNLDTGEESTVRMPSLEARRERQVAQIQSIVGQLQTPSV